MLTIYIRRYSFSLLTILLITFLSVVPVPEVELVRDVPLADKWVHFLMYGFLSLVIWTELCLHAQQPSNTLSHALFYGFVCSSALGGILELVQKYLTTTRSGEWWDFVADIIGALLGSLIGACAYTYIKKRKLT